jgi:hypothetical protein
MKRIALAALWAIAHSFSLHAAAPDPCQDPKFDEIAACQTQVAAQAVDDAAKADVGDAAKAETKRALQAKPTAPDAVGSVASSSVKDFVPPLAAVIQSANLDQKNQQLTLDFNVTSLFKPSFLAVQLQSVVRQPQLYDPVKKALSATQAQQLQGGLSDLSDVAGVLTLGWQDDNFGRHLPANDRAFTALFEAIKRKNAILSQAAVNALERPCIDLEFRLAKREGKDVTQQPKFSDFTAADRQQLKQVCVASAQQLGVAFAAEAKALRDTGIASFADLLNNQQQLVFSGSRRFKNELVGPNETAAQFSYEVCPFGAPNLSSFRNRLAEPDALIDHFKADSAAAKNAARLKVNVQYTWIDRYSLVRSADSLDLLLPKAHRFTASATLGKPLLPGSDGKPTGQLDVTAQYDNFSDDPTHKDRLVASATYTQKLTDSVSLPIGITYANHNEFLTDVQARFSAHFGLKLKLPFGS